MPKRRSKTEDAQAEYVEFVEDALLDYDSPVILTALERLKESKDGQKLLESGAIEGTTWLMPLQGAVPAHAWLLTPLQVKYINAVALGFTSKQACRELGIAKSEPLYWEQVSDKGRLFPLCMRVIKEIKVAELEDEVWDQAVNNPKAAVLKMFALKAAKPEYRDNPPVDKTTETVINVNLVAPDGSVLSYDPKVSFQPKDVTPEGAT